jgi:hypothetical protein
MRGSSLSKLKQMSLPKISSRKFKPEDTLTRSKSGRLAELGVVSIIVDVCGMMAAALLFDGPFELRCPNWSIKI